MDGLTKTGVPNGTTKRQTSEMDSNPYKKIRRGSIPDLPHPPCVFCQSTITPMWRKGPEGKGTLCNACGVRWSLKFRRSAKASKSAATNHTGNNGSKTVSPVLLRSPISSDDSDSFDEDDSDIDDFDDEDDIADEHHRYVPPTSSVRARARPIVKTPASSLPARFKPNMSYNTPSRPLSVQLHHQTRGASSEVLNSPGVVFRSLVDVAEGLRAQVDGVEKLRSSIAEAQMNIARIQNGQQRQMNERSADVQLAISNTPVDSATMVLPAMMCVANKIVNREVERQVGNMLELNGLREKLDVIATLVSTFFPDA